MPDEVKARELRARLDGIAPLPETGPVTALQLARVFGVRAQERWSRQLSGMVPIEDQQLALMLAEYAVAHALTDFAAADKESADHAAARIRDSLADGGSAGEWLWEICGGETASQVTALAKELIAAAPPADQVTVSAEDVKAILLIVDLYVPPHYKPSIIVDRLAKAAGIEVVR